MTTYNDLGVAIKEFKLLEAKTYDFVVHGIVNLGLRKPFAEFDDKGKKNIPHVMFKIIFELPDSIRDDELTDVIGANVSASTFGKSALYKITIACLGDKINGQYNEKLGVYSMKPEYVASEGLKQLLGKTGQLAVIHKEGKNGVFAVVDKDRITALDPRLPKPQPQREAFFFNPMQPDIDVFINNLTYWTQKEIMEALNVSNFPKELHDAWVKIEEDRAASESDEPKATKKSSTPDTKTYDTSSIE